MSVNSVNCMDACCYKPIQKKDNSVSKGFVIGAAAPVATIALGSGATKVAHKINTPKSRLYSMNISKSMDKLANNLDKFGEMSQEKVINAGKKSVAFLTEKTKGSKIGQSTMSKVESFGKKIAQTLKNKPKIGQALFPILATGLVGATIGLIVKACKSDN